MYKKIFVFVVLLALVTALYGCGCNGTVAPTPTPTTNPTSSPTAEIIEPLPDTSMLPENSGTPETSADPGTAGQGAGGTTGGTGATGGTGGTAGTTTGGAGITNFSEGTEVQTGDVPQVESAIKSKYSNATVQSIKHATKNNEQVYAVEIKSGTTTQTVYVRPDGTVLD